ncbi:hypothetical protein C808_01835 [Lachnospiraceae bacterium M18-1]|nr:hypothetical protein C808_01835 [Lachnospiraceae bacterium M18-1]
MATKVNKEEQVIEQEEKKEKTKKQSIPHEKLNKECNNVPYKEITNDDMINYILEYAPKDKKWFKQVVNDNNKADKNGKKRTNFISIKRAFCERYNPSIIPTSKKKKSLLDMVEDW